MPMMSQHCTYNYSQKGFSREKNLSRERAKNTVDNGYHYYGARYYNSNLSIWLSVDSKAHLSPDNTPYHFVDNNPVIKVDPNGEHEYTVAKDGTLALQKETNDEYDMLYRADTYGTSDQGEGQRINDQSILSNLSKEENVEHGRFSKASSNSGSDVFNAFLFLANNSDVEWGAARTEDDEYHLGTYRKDDKSPNPKLYSGSKSVIADIHSHPGQFSGMASEFSSMGLHTNVRFDSYYGWSGSSYMCLVLK